MASARSELCDTALAIMTGLVFGNIVASWSLTNCGTTLQLFDALHVAVAADVLQVVALAGALQVEVLVTALHVTQLTGILTLSALTSGVLHMAVLSGIPKVSWLTGVLIVVVLVDEWFVTNCLMSVIWHGSRSSSTTSSMFDSNWKNKRKNIISTAVICYFYSKPVTEIKSVNKRIENSCQFKKPFSLGVISNSWGLRNCVEGISFILFF